MKRITVQLPATVEETITEIRDDCEVATETGWRLAFRLASVVRLQEPEGRPSVDTRTSTSMSPSEFAAFGFRGLKTDKTVTRYVQAWLGAQSGYVASDPKTWKYPKQGSKRALPTIDFPTDASNLGSRPNTKSPTKVAEIVAEAVRLLGAADVMEALVEALPAEAKVALGEALFPEDDDLDPIEDDDLDMLLDPIEDKLHSLRKLGILVDKEWDELAPEALRLSLEGDGVVFAQWDALGQRITASAAVDVPSDLSEMMS